jgi:hypothetical protein
MALSKRLLSNWNLKRVAFAGIGILMMIQAIMDHHWIGVGIGVYFASMGIFSFGCAGNQCFTNECEVSQDGKL